MKFGVGIPTCTEGLMYPIPFAKPQDVVRISVEAERLGFDSVMGNDHLTTQKYVRKEFPGKYPSFYEPLITLSFVAAATKTLRLATGILVLPMRDPVVTAKQVATLDLFSGGRVILGVGVGAYREEFEAVRPSAAGANRGEMVEESVRAMRHLWENEVASWKGKYYEYSEVELFPKPRQNPVPVYFGGNSPEGLRRAGELGDGWLPAILTPAEIKASIEKIHAFARAAGRDPDRLEIAPQLTVCVGKTYEDAMSRFRASQMYKHLESLKKSTLKNQDSNYEDRSLIGSPDQILEKVSQYRNDGVTTISGMLFAANTAEEMLEQMNMFSEGVIRRIK